ncbi:MAG: alkaline phosphatase family protein [Myxococcales bacterium]|nr:alkaline phosphatase family protein [Myxococcales bacterium]
MRTAGTRFGLMSGECSLCRGLALLLSCLSLVLALRPGDARGQGAPKRPHVLLISIDGLGWSLFQRRDVRLPTLRRLASRGVVGPALSVFPANTWPAHATMISGCYPARHGVIGNRFRDPTTGRETLSFSVPRRRLLRVPTLFDVLHRAKISTAAVFWPGSQGDASVDWNVPYVYGQLAFEHGSSPGLLAELARSGFPSESLWKFMSLNDPYTADHAALEIARFLVARHKPRMMALHFDAVDLLAHQFGPTSATVRWGLEAVDRMIAATLASYRRAKILDQTVVIVVSDHGFVRATRAFDIQRLVTAAGASISTKKNGRPNVRVILDGMVAYLYLAPAAQRPRPLAKLVAALRRQPEIERILEPGDYRRYGLPLPRDNARAPSLIAVARPGVIFGPVHDRRGLSAPVSRRGTHGYWPSDPRMRSVFLISGPGVRRAKLHAPFRMIDLAPTILRVFRRAFSGAIDGRPMRGIPPRRTSTISRR